jgi:hypothetical protein
MTLDTLLKDITDEMQKPSKDINLSKMKSKLSISVGLLQDDKTEVPGELFNLFPEEIKRAAMMVVMQLVAQTLAE